MRGKAPLGTRILGHRGLIRDPLDELRIEQLVFALVMDVQCRNCEIDVIGQERGSIRRRRPCGAHQPRGFVVRLAERAVDDGHVTHVDRLRRQHLVPPITCLGSSSLPGSARLPDFIMTGGSRTIQAYLPGSESG